MSTLVLDQAQVEELLTMPECIELMEETLVALAREELYQPLRSVVRPPGADGFMGLMPAHRGGDKPAFGLKVVCIFPGNPARGLDAHQGAVVLFDGETGEVPGDRERVRDHGDPDGRGLRPVATRALARDDARTLAILGAGRAGEVAPRGDAGVAPVGAGRRVEPHARARRAARRRGRRHRGGGAARRRRRVHDDGVVREPVVRREWLPEQGRARERGRLQHRDDPRARHRDDVAPPPLFVDRRESTLNEAGDYLFPAGEGAIGPEHIRAELGELLGAAPAGA